MDAAKFSFRITAFSPETIPMSRLAEYMAQYAALMGHEVHVHFDGLKAGSTMLRSRVEAEDAPKVEQRLRAVAAQPDGSGDTAKAFQAINRLLRADNAEGTIKRAGARSTIVKFPGARQAMPERIGPIREAGQLEGLIVRVGGKDRTIHAQLVAADGEEYALVTTDREVAKELGRRLYTTIRVLGMGTWYRTEAGEWALEHFNVREVQSVPDLSLADALEGLRAVQGSGWSSVADPVAEWQKIRRH